MRTKSAIVFACGLAMLAVVQGRFSSSSRRHSTARRQRRTGRPGWRWWPRRRADPVRQLHRVRQDLRRRDADQLGRRSRRSGGSRAARSSARPRQRSRVTENTFLIYRGSEPDNFELKLEFKMNSTNSGVQYRSRQLTGAVGKWVLCGYQADIDFANALHRNAVRGARPSRLPRAARNGAVRGAERREAGAVQQRPAGGAARPGRRTRRRCRRPARPTPARRRHRRAAPPPPLRGQIGQVEDGEALRGIIKVNDWNQFHIIARGNTLIHLLNGHVTAVFVDDDQANRSMKGLLGVQIHTGPPMKIEFRNIYLKNLK